MVRESLVGLATGRSTLGCAAHLVAHHQHHAGAALQHGGDGVAVQGVELRKLWRGREAGGK